MHSLFNMINGNERQSRSNDINFSTIQSDQASEILEKPSENPLSESMNDSTHNIECNKDNLEKGSRKEITIKEFVQNKGSFNNHVDRMRGGGGQPNVHDCPR